MAPFKAFNRTGLDGMGYDRPPIPTERCLLLVASCGEFNPFLNTELFLVGLHVAQRVRNIQISKWFDLLRVAS